MSNPKGTLLVVDDEDEILSVVTLMLEEVTEETLTALSAQEAEEIIKEKKVHCVLSDISMPGRSGIDLIKSVRKDNPDLPFIFYSGYGNDEYMIQALKYGAFDFVDKPALDNLEGIVTKGLQKGLEVFDGIVLDDELEDSEDDFVSEYQELSTKDK